MRNRHWGERAGNWRCSEALKAPCRLHLSHWHGPRQWDGLVEAGFAYFAFPSRGKRPGTTPNFSRLWHALSAVPRGRRQGVFAWCFASHACSSRCQV